MPRQQTRELCHVSILANTVTSVTCFVIQKAFVMCHFAKQLQQAHACLTYIPTQSAMSVVAVTATMPLGNTYDTIWLLLTSFLAPEKQMRTIVCLVPMVWFDYKGRQLYCPIIDKYCRWLYQKKKSENYYKHVFQISILHVAFDICK